MAYTMMTEAPKDVPSSQRAEIGSVMLNAAVFPPPAVPNSQDPFDVAEAWVREFNQLIKSANYSKFEDLFLEECYWRDHLCLSWDFRTLKGPHSAATFLGSNGCRIKSIALDKSTDVRIPAKHQFDVNGDIHGVQAFLTIESEVGSGHGVVKLVHHTQWKVFTLYTSLTALRGYTEKLGKLRPLGVEMGMQKNRTTWHDKRAAQENMTDMDPPVLIVGAGQAGLTIAARLKTLGIEALVVDKEERIGDNWRLRYDQLVLHDPVWFDHLPYLPFPLTWPVFSPKNKIAEWFEIYAKTLELNVWTNTKLTSSSWHDDTNRWTVSLNRNVNDKVETRVFHPRHIIQATGHSGEKNFPSDIEGIGDFQGTRLVHSSEFTGATPNSVGKKAIVVGCCNSAHDLAQDFCENGYDVTMIQRSSTYVVDRNTNVDITLSSVYSETGPPTADADLLFFGTPNAVIKTNSIPGTAHMAKIDSILLSGLTNAGFKLDNGPDDSGLWMKYLQRGGGYYIDVGCSQLIIDGKIALKQGQPIASIRAHSVVLVDGTELPADEIVFATGYQNMRSTTRKLFGQEVADRVGDVWGFDADGELRGMWRKTGHPGFWFAGGNLAMCRYFSQFLALEIKALVEGVCNYSDV